MSIFIDFSAFLIYQLLTGGVKSPTFIMDAPIRPPVTHHNYHLSVPISLYSRLSRSQCLSGFVCLYRFQGGTLLCKFSFLMSKITDFRVTHLCCCCGDKIDDFQALYVTGTETRSRKLVLTLFSSQTGEYTLQRSGRTAYTEDLLVCSSNDTKPGKTVGATNWLGLQ